MFSTVSALVLLACMAIGGHAVAQPIPPDAGAWLVAQSRDMPLVQRPPRGTCYDPPPRIACKQRCESSSAQCGPDRPACDKQLAKCVSSCPPKVCSRGGVK
jgi:hypothetical protein